jgi:hypothetical protein
MRDDLYGIGHHIRYLILSQHKVLILKPCLKIVIRKIKFAQNFKTERIYNSDLRFNLNFKILAIWSFFIGQ